MQQGVGRLYGEIARPFEGVVQVRLGEARPAGEAALCEFASLDAQAHELD